MSLIKNTKNLKLTILAALKYQSIFSSLKNHYVFKNLLVDLYPVSVLKSIQIERFFSKQSFFSRKDQSSSLMPLIIMSTEDFFDSIYWVSYIRKLNVRCRIITKNIMRSFHIMQVSLLLSNIYQLLLVSSIETLDKFTLRV